MLLCSNALLVTFVHMPCRKFVSGTLSIAGRSCGALPTTTTVLPSLPRSNSSLRKEEGLTIDGSTGWCSRIGLHSMRHLVKDHEQELQDPRKANQDKTDSYCLDRRCVIPQAEFRGPFPDQIVMTPESPNDHREAKESDHIGEDSSLHG